MRIKNNKGFTLVELIIAMSILSIVLGLGYKVITGTSKVTKNQTEIFSEQQSANLVNKYLTKDLEQVIQFTEANTSLNPYTYVLNEGVEGREQVEYEVKKTDDGKFYTLTRKTSSVSIELISNYPTSSEVPFSINKVKNSENIFKVVLNGKGKDFEVGKYEFEVTSRIENVIAMGGDTEIEGGDTEIEGGDTEIEGGGSQDQPEVQDFLNGEIEFYFLNHNKNYDRVKATAHIYEQFGDKDNNITVTSKNIDKQSEYTIQAKIPVKNIVDVGISVSRYNNWDVNTSFGTGWDKFDIKKLINTGIHIYPGKDLTIDSVYVGLDRLTVNENEDDKYKYGTYYYPISESITANHVIVKAKVKVINYTPESKLTIGFGKYDYTPN